MYIFGLIQFQFFLKRIYYIFDKQIKYLSKAGIKTFLLSIKLKGF